MLNFLNGQGGHQQEVDEQNRSIDVDMTEDENGADAQQQQRVFGRELEDEAEIISETNAKMPSNMDEIDDENDKNEHTAVHESELQRGEESSRAVALNQQQEDEYEPDDDDDDASDDEEEFNPYLFIKHLPPYSLTRIPHKVHLAPKLSSTPPITLVLDLDETLVHCTIEPIPDADLVFPVVFNGISYQVHVRKRPHLAQFLESIHGKFEVVVFTASQRVYADELLDRIDPQKKYIQKRLFRESCLPVEGNYLKDLTVLNRDLKKMVLVDNSPHAFGYQVDNGIPIESWFDDSEDTELIKLEKFLRNLHGTEDVRSVVRDRFQTWRLIQNA
uniref:FCP1 homology domain-containing protein n=1 Tax=Proboscia inermis TaxID=420281 RepID=A0A7S0C7X3_9STRA|mmetsp:Transcript_29316/g.29717  ORF Transcript_29316/g.29717 Transcript_29316/m.29717 type:complete len:331 (+) Transcript_29316:1-993(+)